MCFLRFDPRQHDRISHWSVNASWETLRSTYSLVHVKCEEPNSAPVIGLRHAQPGAKKRQNVRKTLQGVRGRKKKNRWAVRASWSQWAHLPLSSAGCPAPQSKYWHPTPSSTRPFKSFPPTTSLRNFLPSLLVSHTRFKHPICELVCLSPVSTYIHHSFRH